MKRSNLEKKGSVEEKKFQKRRETRTVAELVPDLESKDGPRVGTSSSPISRGNLSPSVGGGDGTIKLDGEWEFYPFMLPVENSELPEERRYFVEVPKVWNGFVYKGENDETKKMSGVGYGTYRLKILTSVVQVSL